MERETLEQFMKSSVPATKEEIEETTLDPEEIDRIQRKVIEEMRLLRKKPSKS